MRPHKDETWLGVAADLAKQGTCGRRQVGCVLVDFDGFVLSTGYNGPASGEPHCMEQPCPGLNLPSGTGLDTCEAVHAEQNALLFCSDVRSIWTAYVTASPCLTCVKLLMNTSCVRIVFIQPYAHDDEARRRWLDSRPALPKIGHPGGLREWQQLDIYSYIFYGAR